DLIVEIEAGIVLAVIIIDLHSLFIFYADRNKEVRFIIASHRRYIIVLESSITNDNIPPVCIWIPKRVYHTKSHPLVNRSVLELLEAWEGVRSSPALVECQC